jgi:alcohol dehydrogenase (NADP+)
MKTLKFANNDEMPALGLGTWKSEPGEVYNAVREAIWMGYRHIDCAPIYGNEKEIGKAIAEVIANGDVTREELWITSKLWNNKHRRNQVIPALSQTIEDLQCGHLDLFLVHWPVVLADGVGFPESGDDLISLSEVPIAETWSGMEEGKDIGLAKHIGVSNFSVTKLKELAKANVQPEMNQIEMHPLLQQPGMLEYCNANGILLTAYSPLGSPDRMKELKAPDEPNLLTNPVISTIAERHAASSAQILIAWAIQRGTSVIPKSVNVGRLRQNFEAGKLQLTDQDMDQIKSLDEHYRFVKGQFWALEGSDYTVANLWDE